MVKTFPAAFKKTFEADGIFVAIFVLVLLIALLPFYCNGGLVLGGEGNVFLDYSLHLKNFRFMWLPTYAHGRTNACPSGTGLNILFLLLLERLTGSAIFVNFSLVFLIYFLPFFFFQRACRRMGASALSAFLVASFYVINPFSLYYLASLNQWNVFSLALMPFFLWIILKYHKDPLRLFFYTGAGSFCFSFSFTNPPSALIVLLAMSISLVFAESLGGAGFKITPLLKKFGLILISFCLCNAWWLIGFLLTGISSVGKVYTQSSATAWLKSTVAGHGAIIAKTLSLTTIIPKNPKYDFYSFWFNTLPSKIILLIPILIVVGLSVYPKNKLEQKKYFPMLFFLLAALTLMKGPTGLFGFVYSFLFNYLPGFYVFKTPVEKFGLLYIFIFSVILLILLKDHARAFARNMLIFYLIFCSVPLFSGNLIAEYDIPPHGKCSRKYRESEGYLQMRRELVADGTQHRILSMPGVTNYQVCLRTVDKKLYTGMDPLLMNTDKPFIATQNYIDGLYENVAVPKYSELLGLYGVKKILVNEDLIPWFGVIGPGDPAELEKFLDAHGFQKFRKGRLVLYFNHLESFSPLIFVSSTSAPVTRGQ